MNVSSLADHDIFISYSHLDDDGGWVTRTHKLLEGVIFRVLGTRKVRIFRDTQAQANNRVPELCDIAARSKLFLAFGSPGFVNSRHCCAELEAFVAAHHDPKRIFVAELQPLIAPAVWPPEISSHIRKQFFFRDGNGNPTPHRISEDLQRTLYLKGLTELGTEMAMALSTLANSSDLGTPTIAATAAAPAGMASSEPASLPEGFEAKTVLIAQPTDGLIDECDQLRTYLTQFGVTVLPDGDYPQGGTDFRTAFLVDLDRADLVVQLLDSKLGRKPADLPEGYTAFQAAAAAENNVELMQWRRPDLDVDSVAPDYRQMLLGRSVIASGFQEFKAAVKKQAIVPVTVNRPPNGAVVYIHADPSDTGWAERIANSGQRYRLFCKWPHYRADRKTASDTEMMDELAGSNAVLILYCDASPEWVRKQGQWIWKYFDSHNGQIVAICEGPPDGKPQLNFMYPGARTIHNADEAHFLEEIDRLLAEIAA